MNGAYAKRKGNNYERKLVKEHHELGFTDAKTSRSESKNLDDKGVDIVSDQIPYYVQAKTTQNNPAYHDLINNFTLSDRPLVIFHNKQVKKESKCVSDGEFVIMEKKFFYDLIKTKKDVKEKDVKKNSKQRSGA